MQRTDLSFAYIERCVPLQRVLEHFGVLGSLRGDDNVRRGPCPIHRSKSPKSENFHVKLNTSEWKCFSPQCGRGGRTIRFVAMMKNMSSQEAAAWLMDQFLAAPPQQRSKPMSKGPALIAYSVSDREYTDDNGEVRKGWWTRIGSAFKNENGGYTIALDALPAPSIYDGKVQTRIVLSPPKEPEVKEERRSESKRR